MSRFDYADGDDQGRRLRVGRGDNREGDRIGGLNDEQERESDVGGLPIITDPAHIADMPFLSSDVNPRPLTSIVQMPPITRLLII
jgi:hypothetical protein